MPRIKNYLLRTFFEKRSEKLVVCKNEKCNNKMLNLHAGNLERHLKTFHPSVYYNYLQSKNSIILNRNKNDTAKLSCSVNKKHMQTALVELFTKSGRPFGLAEDQPFKILLSPVLNELKIKLSEQNIMENIAEYSVNLRKELTNELRGRLISLKIDAARRTAESLISVNVQFIKNNSIILKTLSIQQLTPGHTTEYLRTLILGVLSEYNINIDQVITITTDNVADALKSHNGSNYGMNNVSDEICVHDDLKRTVDLSIDGISYVCSGAHILQLCVMDVLEVTDMEDKLNIIRSIIEKLRNPLYLTLLKSGNYETPLLDNNNRWTSTYQMVERFVELKNFIEDIKHDISFDLSNIWPFAVEFLTVFKVVYTSSKKLQTENLTYSDLYIEITNISLQLEHTPKSELIFILIGSLNRQKLKLFESDLFVTAVFLDPRIKVCLTADQCTRAKSCIMQLYTRLVFLREGDTKFVKQSAETYGSTTPSATSAATMPAENAEDALEEYFKAFDQVAKKNIFTTSQQIEQDILAYAGQSRLGIKENILHFWNQQKNTLTEIAYLVLGIPCTQLSLERLISALDYLQDNQNSKLNFTDLEHILLVKSNAEFVYD